MGRRNGRRTVTSALALLTVSLLGLAGNQLAHADPSTSPFPTAAAAPAEAAPAVEPSAQQGAEGAGSAPAAALPYDSAPAVGSTAGAAASVEGRADEPAEDRDEPAPEKPESGEKPASDEKPAVDEKPAAGEPAGDDQGPVNATAAGQVAAGAPDAASATTAAEKFGWGKPLPGSDEFNYTGPPDPKKWNVAGECWAGHAGNGKRCASRSTVDGSKLVQTGLANGDSGWVASKTDQRYGRWEARVRSVGKGPANGRQYHPLLIIWPQSNQWPEDGEYDFLENGAPGQQCAEAFIHYPHGPGAVQQEFAKEKNCGAPMSEWHNVAFEWTPDAVRGFIDGKKWFEYSGGAGGSRRNIQDMPSGHLTIQLDNFFGGNMQPATYEVDWVRIYAPK